MTVTIENKGTERPTGVTTDVTYTANKTQMTVDKKSKIGKNQIYTIKGMAGKTITGLSLSMRSNKSSGAGAMELKAGNTILASIGKVNDITQAIGTPKGPEGVNFNDVKWHGSYEGKNYVDINVPLTNKSYKIQTNEDIVLTIVATTNSIYCENITIQYTE